jgi:hypothetical protein
MSKIKQKFNKIKTIYFISELSKQHLFTREYHYYYFGKLKYLARLNHDYHNYTSLEYPSTLYLSENGNLIYIRYKNEQGLLHKTDGPAHIYYHKDGTTIESYFINDVQLNKDKWFIELNKQDQIKHLYQQNNHPMFFSDFSNFKIKRSVIINETKRSY